MWEKNSECVRTNLNKTSNNKKFNTIESFAANTLFVLGLQQIGGGPAECQVLLTYLELPHSASFSRKAFCKIESKLGTVIKRIAKDSMEKAIDEEVRLTRTKEDYEKYKKKSCQPMLRVLP